MPSLFLELPVEIRLEIARYLVGRYTEQEVNVNSREYNSDRKRILKGGDFTHQFHPAILYANKQIRKEALDVLLHESALVHVTTRLWNYNILESTGLSIMAKDTSARLFPYAAMTLEFDGAYSPRELQQQSWSCSWSRERIHFLTGTSDLPILCAMMTRETRNLRSPTLKIRMGERFEGCPELAKSYLDTLLPCLDHVRGFETVKLQSLPYSTLYSTLVDNTVASMCDRRRSAAEIMHAVSETIDRATRALEEGKHQQAINDHKLARNILRGSCFDENESFEVLVGGRYDGMEAYLARDNSEIQLYSLIAASYLQLGRSRLARIYVERIYRPLCSYDHRGNREKFPLQIVKGSPEVYAELLAVAAQISLFHGRWREAFMELHYAEQFDPTNIKVQQQHIRYENYMLKACARDRRVKKKEGKIEEKKIEAFLQIVRNRQSKGDQYFYAADFRRAHSKYHAALTKAKECRYSEEELCHSLRSSLAVVSLKLGLYDGACYWAGEILEAAREYWRYHYPADDDNDTHRRFYTAYWAMGVALEKLGNIDEAIDNLERAEVCDPKCEDTRRRLAALTENAYIEPLVGTTSIAKLLDW